MREKPWRCRRHRAESADRAKKQEDQRSNSRPPPAFEDSNAGCNIQSRVPSREAPRQGDWFLLLQCIHFNLKTIARHTKSLSTPRTPSPDRSKKQKDQRSNSAPPMSFGDSKAGRGIQNRMPSREAPRQGDCFLLL